MAHASMRFYDTTRQCVAVCCSVLQCVAVCCSVLQCVALCCNVFQRESHLIRVNESWHINQWGLTTQLFNVLQCVAVCCSMLQCVAVCCSVRVISHARMSHGTCINEVLRHESCVCCSVLQCVAVCCSARVNSYARMSHGTCIDEARHGSETHCLNIYELHHSFVTVCHLRFSRQIRVLSRTSHLSRRHD